MDPMVDTLVDLQWVPWWILVDPDGSIIGSLDGSMVDPLVVPDGSHGGLLDGSKWNLVDPDGFLGGSRWVPWWILWCFPMDPLVDPLMEPRWIP